MYRALSFLAFIGCIVWLYREPSPEPVVCLLTAFASFFRDELHGIVGVNVFSLTPRNKLIRDLKTSKYSFITSEFINPRIVHDLIGWISDSGSEIVSVDLTKSNKSNRYFCSISTENNERSSPKVVAIYDHEYFSYQYIGCSFSGMHILQTWSGGSGSGVFSDIVLVTLSLEKALENTPRGTEKIDRFVIKLIGTFPLGDRYEGNVSYKCGFLHIPACKGRGALRIKAVLSLII